jgi:hypothetical protein
MSNVCTSCHGTSAKLERVLSRDGPRHLVEFQAQLQRHPDAATAVHSGRGRPAIGVCRQVGTDSQLGERPEDWGPVFERAFRAAFKKRRCLVAVTGFYEWDQHHIVKGKPKQPYYFTLQDGRPMTFAGLWESWLSPEQETIATCTIITCGPNEIMEPLHDRLPVILPSNLWDVWLDPEMDPVGLKDLLVPFDAHEMQLWPVSSKMNSTRGSDYHFGLECIEPIEVEPPQIQQSLF